MRRIVTGVLIVLCMVSCKPAHRSTGRMVEFVGDGQLMVMAYCGEQVYVSETNTGLAAYLDGPALLSICAQTPHIVDESVVERQSLYLYLPEDGNRLHLRVDGDLLYVNGILRSICMDSTNSTGFDHWYKTADNKAIEGLRLVCAPAFRKEIEAIRQVNPRVTIVTHENDSNDDPVYSDGPGFLILEEGFSETMLRQLDCSETRLIWIEDRISKEMIDILSGKSMPKLQSIMMPFTEDSLRLLEAIPYIQHLTIGDGESTPDLAKLDHLKTLNLLEGNLEESLDLSLLPNPRLLSALSIPNTSSVTGLEKLTELRYLNVGVTTFSDDELHHLLEQHPKLIFLDLGSSSVDSLQPLTAAKCLEGIRLPSDSKNKTEFDFTPLGGIKTLRYIALCGDISEQPGVHEQIRKACPQCLIYGQDGFCMGSGWLVLFIPLLGAVMLFKHLGSTHSREDVNC